MRYSLSLDRERGGVRIEDAGAPSPSGDEGDHGGSPYHIGEMKAEAAVPWGAALPCGSSAIM
jgi:hypothetical protein